MASDLYLHIGMPKTGTTAIQHFLTGNRAKLAAQGVLYPAGGTVRAGHHILGAAVFPRRAAPLEGVPREVALERAMTAILSEIDAARPRTVILSTEFLWGNLPAAKIGRLLGPLKGLRIHVVPYLRRQDLFAQSLYMQAVKGGHARPFAAWLDGAEESAKGGFHYDRVLNAWRDCGLPVSVEPRVYEKGQIEADVRRDFINTVAPGVDVDYPDESRRLNTTPDMLTIGILRAINASLEAGESTNRIRRRILLESPPRDTSAQLGYFREGEAEAFLAHFAASNARIARDYLRRPDGILFREPVRAGERETASEEAVLGRLVAMLPRLVVLPPRKAKPPGGDNAARKQRKRMQHA
jgi:hypothetical protein